MREKKQKQEQVHLYFVEQRQKERRNIMNPLKFESIRR